MVLEVECGRPGRPRKNRMGELDELLELYGKDRAQIAGAMGVTRKTLRTYLWQLRKLKAERERSVLRNVPRNRCPECRGSLTRRDGEEVCTRCGIVVRDGFEEPRLPMGMAYAMENGLAFGKSLGETLNPRLIHKVIARPLEGFNRDDPGLRARHIKIMSSMVEPPAIKRLLECGSQLLKERGLDVDVELVHVFSNRYGELLRELGTYVILKRLSVHYVKLARAAFYRLGREAYPDLRERLEELRAGFRDGDLELVDRVREICR